MEAMNLDFSWLLLYVLLPWVTSNLYPFPVITVTMSIDVFREFCEY